MEADREIGRSIHKYEQIEVGRLVCFGLFLWHINHLMPNPFVFI